MVMKFIDVSHHNGAMDWQKAQAAGAQGAYFKASQGTSLTDTQFKRNVANCRLKYQGGYHFFDYTLQHYTAGDEAGFGIRQANYFLNLLGDWKYTLPGALDIENNKAYWEDLNTNIPRALKIARAFVDRYKAVTGHAPVIYCSSYFTKYLKEFTDCPLWVAHYEVSKPVYYNWTGHILWQYSSKGDGALYGNAEGNDYIDLNEVGIPVDSWAIGGQAVSYPDRLVYPVNPATRISQYFGERPNVYTTSKGHNGIDWACVVGTPIYAMQDGMVIRAADFSQPGITDGKVGYGRHVRIEHPEGVSIYGHLSRLMVAEGDSVKAGQQIGLSGGATTDPNCGYSTGPHLHAEYRLTSGAPQVAGGYAYGAIDILPLLQDVPAEPEPEPAPIEVGTQVRTLVNLNIRKGAGVGYGIWATAPKGTQLDVLEVKGDWVRVGWNQWALSIYNGVRYLE